MTEIQKDNKNIGKVPNLRFPGFEGGWEEKRLREICEINPKSEDLPQSFIYIDLESVENGRLMKEDVIFKDEAPSRAQRILLKNDILFQTVRPYQKNNLLFNKIGKYVASTGYAQLRTKQNSQFVYQYLHNQKFVDKVIERCTGTSYPAINSKDLGNIRVRYPSIEEQEKISSFLSLIDVRIITQNKIIEQLELYFQGISDNVFSRQIGFKGASDEWELETLGNIGSTYNGLSGKTVEDFGDGKMYIQYKQIFDKSKIKLSDCGIVRVDENENQNKAKYGDIFFTISSETPNEIGMSSVLLDNVEEIYLNSFCFGFRIHSFKKMLPEFARFLFRSKEFRFSIIKLAQGSTRYNMSKREFIKLSVKIPSLEEQTKIASFMSAIDQKIETEKAILEQLQLQKKYILQQMFV